MISALFSRTDITPPGGWKYTQPESGMSFKTATLDELYQQIETHRRVNKYDLDSGWWEQVQLEMCEADETFASRYCKTIAPPVQGKQRSINVVDLLTFFRTMRKWVAKHGFTKAPDTVIAERTAICAECPKNVSVAGCTGCQGAVRWLAEFMTREERDHPSPLNNCEVCGCVLKLKVLLPDEVIKETVNPRHEYPDHCWVKQR